MNGHWTVAIDGTRCGAGEGHDVPLDAPVYLLAGRIVRCETHAPEHARVDTDAIERVCVEAEARRAAETASDVTPPSTPAPPGFRSFAHTVAPQRMQRGLARRGIRVHAPRKPQPFAAVAAVPDPKSDAFNR